MIDIIVGTRPNFVKIASLFNAKNSSLLNFRLIHTGQHYDHVMSSIFFDELGIPEPMKNLGVGSGSHSEQTAKIMLEYEKLLQVSRPKMVVVVGDVNSTMACAIAAKKTGLPLGHIESGLRSYDREMPEEINRIITDSISDIFFTTSKNASNNLIKENIDSSKIFFVGNTMADTLLSNMSSFKKPQLWNSLSLQEKKYLVLTLHRESNVQDYNKLKRLISEIMEVCPFDKLIFPMHPRLTSFAEQMDFSNPRLIITKPMSYLEFNFLVQHSKAVITDSGGISEETTIMKIPCLTIRENTERPETCEIGTNELVGFNFEKLRNSLSRINDSEWKSSQLPEKWDGLAGYRINEVLRTIAQ